MKVLTGLAVVIALAASFAVGVDAQAPIESELTLITPVSKFIHDAALKAFAEYAKEKWNVTVKTNAIPAGTPVAYGRIVEWKGRPDADIFWGGESALFEKLAEQKLLQKIEISKEAWDSIPATFERLPQRSSRDWIRFECSRPNGIKTPITTRRGNVANLQCSGPGT